MPLVYSTQTSSTEYCEWLPGGADLMRKGRSVIINGGAGIAQKKTLLTPLGVSTEVTPEQLAFLEGLPAFQRHKDAGFIKVVARGKPDADKISADMAQRDGSAPMVPNDYKPEEAPKTGAAAKSAITTAPRFKAKNSAFR